MNRNIYFSGICLLLLSLFLWGCPKKVEIIPPEKPPYENPIAKLLEAFSSAESLQARTVIRIETLRDGEEMNFLLNGFLFYQKPDKFRLLGYHPLGMGLFDALYREGQFFLLIPPQKRAYRGELHQVGDLIAKAGEIRISSDKGQEKDVPSWVQIEFLEKETRIELKLRGTSVNLPLAEENFEWNVPEGVEVRPLERLLRGLRRR